MATTNTALGCASVVTNPASPTSFSVAANYASNCLMQTSNLDFGTIGALNSNIDAETTLAVTCSTGNVYTVALDGGAANATDPALRRLNNNGTTVIYGLYRNATRTNGWGADATTAAGGTGNGLAQVLTVYGRIPKQPFPPVGTYQDTIVVTLTY